MSLSPLMHDIIFLKECGLKCQHVSTCFSPVFDMILLDKFTSNEKNSTLLRYDWHLIAKCVTFMHVLHCLLFSFCNYCFIKELASYRISVALFFVCLFLYIVYSIYKKSIGKNVFLTVKNIQMASTEVLINNYSWHSVIFKCCVI